MVQLIRRWQHHPLAALVALALALGFWHWGAARSFAQEGGTSEIDWVELGLGVVGGLALFLYGVTRLSQALKDVAEERVKDAMARFTKNRFAGVATGTVATAILDSSSVTIIMVIALVNASILPFAGSLAVIMGSNIGTTVSSILFATNLDTYAPIILLIGLAMHYVFKQETVREIGLVVLGLGLVFFGLNIIGDAVEPLREYEPFLQLMESAGENPWLGVLLGALFTLVIQSSSATLGVIIALASQGAVDLPIGVALMLGAEIGTCSDTLMATIGRSRAAVRAGVFHLLFNIVSVILGVIFVGQLAQVGQLIGGGAVEMQIAWAQVAFNTIGVLLFLPFVGIIARMLETVIPDGRANLEPATA